MHCMNGLEHVTKRSTHVFAAEGVKRELEEGISAMGLRVKFDLLHDEMPQVEV